jgi:hypothetical protein
VEVLKLNIEEKEKEEEEEEEDESKPKAGPSIRDFEIVKPISRGSYG